MARRTATPPAAPDNPNKPGVGPNKGDLQAGDIRWVVEPPKPKERVLSKAQRKDLASRIRAKLSRKP